METLAVKYLLEMVRRPYVSLKHEDEDGDGFVVVVVVVASAGFDDDNDDDDDDCFLKNDTNAFRNNLALMSPLPSEGPIRMMEVETIEWMES